MEREQCEAMILEKLKPCRLFAAFGAGDYLLPEPVLLVLIQSAYLAGQEYQNEKIAKRWMEIEAEESVASVRIAE